MKAGRVSPCLPRNKRKRAIGKNPSDRDAGKVDDSAAYAIPEAVTYLHLDFTGSINVAAELAWRMVKILPVITGRIRDGRQPAIRLHRIKRRITRVILLLAARVRFWSAFHGGLAFLGCGGAF